MARLQESSTTLDHTKPLLGIETCPTVYVETADPPSARREHSPGPWAVTRLNESNPELRLMLPRICTPASLAVVRLPQSTLLK
jgi:hypothetical protein